MKTFKQFISEARDYAIGLTPRGLKAFTLNTKKKASRYIIGPNGKLSASDLWTKNHDILYDLADKNDDRKRAIAGYIQQRPDGTWIHRPVYVGSGRKGYFDIEKAPDRTTHGISHPLFKRFAKLGIERSRKALGIEM